MKERLLKDWPSLLLRLIGYVFVMGMIYQRSESLTEAMIKLAKGQEDMQAAISKINENLGRQDERIKAQGAQINRLEKE